MNAEPPRTRFQMEHQPRRPGYAKRSPTKCMTRTQHFKLLTMLSWLLSLFGCGGAESPSGDLDPNASIVREIAIAGFDADGEPVIREMSDGSLWIQFEAMPPFFTDDDPASFDIDTFRSQMQLAAGAAVVQDDREVFFIAEPARETLDSVKFWLEAYRKTNDREQ